MSETNPLHTIDEYTRVLDKNIEAAGDDRIKRVESGETEAISQAARVMAEAFINSEDQTWLSYLPISVIEDAYKNGKPEEAIGRTERVLNYLIGSSVKRGGTLVVAEVEENGEKRMVGAALREFPGLKKEGLWSKYVKGGVATITAWGLGAALQSDKNYSAMNKAAEDALAENGVDKKQVIHNALIAVRPENQGQGIYSSLTEPFNRTADELGMFILLESSNPGQNDERVFRKFGFVAIKQHVYDQAVPAAEESGDSRDKVVTIMLRQPVDRAA